MRNRSRDLVDGRRRRGRGKAENAGHVLRNERHAHRPVAPQRANDGGAIADRPRGLLGLPARRRRLGDTGIEDAGSDLELRAGDGANAPACAMACGRWRSAITKATALADKRRDSGARRPATARSIGSSLSWQVRRISRNDSTIAGSVLRLGRHLPDVVAKRRRLAASRSARASRAPRADDAARSAIAPARSGPATDRPALDSNRLHRAAASASTNLPPSIKHAGALDQRLRRLEAFGRRALVHLHRRRDQPRPPQLARHAAHDEMRSRRPWSRA